MHVRHKTQHLRRMLPVLHRQLAPQLLIVPHHHHALARAVHFLLSPEDRPPRPPAVRKGGPHLSSPGRIAPTAPRPNPPLGTSSTGRSSRSPSVLRTAFTSSLAENLADIGMPVTTTFSSAAPRATKRALVWSAATQYKSTHASIHNAWASKSVTTLTANGLGPPRFPRKWLSVSSGK